MNDYGAFRRHLGAVPFECIMLGGAAVTAMKGDRLHVITSLFTFAVSFLPLLAERWLRVRLPVWLQATYVGFIFASMFSGEVLGMYGRIWQWDDIVHFISGLLVGLAAILLLTELKRRRSMRLPAWLQVVLIFSLGASVAVLWEIAEFTSDHLFGTFSQGGDLVDTMLDLIDGGGGALIMALAYGAYLRGRPVRFLRYLIDGFHRSNDK